MARQKLATLREMPALPAMDAPLTETEIQAQNPTLFGLPKEAVIFGVILLLAYIVFTRKGK